MTVFWQEDPGGGEKLQESKNPRVREIGENLGWQVAGAAPEQKQRGQKKDILCRILILSSDFPWKGGGINIANMAR